MKHVVGVLLVAAILVLPAQAAAPSPAAQTQQFALAAQKAMKLLVDKDGWQRVSFANLRKAGFAVPKKTANLQVFADGVQVPIRIPRGAIEFYGTGLDTDVTDTHVYWLINGKTKGLRIPVVKAGTARPAQPAGSFGTLVLVEPRSSYFTPVLNGQASNFFGGFIQPGKVTTQQVSLQHVNPAATASLRVAVQGYSTVNHVVKVTWNGTAVGNLSFKGQVLTSASFPLPGSSLQEGDNALTLTAAGGEIDFNLLDSVQVSYQHQYLADGDVLSFAPRRGTTTVGGFSTKNIRVVDVSQAGRPRELVPTRGGVAGNYTATFTAPAGATRLYAFANFKALAPGLAANVPSSLNAATQSADLVIISHQTFIPALKPLVDLRQAEGFKTLVVDIDDVYDEFAAGAKDPEAIKAFLAWAKAHWQKAPRYVLFVGDASYDPRNLTGKAGPDFVPTEFVDTQYLVAPSDDALADFNGDAIPEMAVGRLPVSTLDQANALVAKLVRYDQATRPRSLLLVADKNIDYDFEAQSRTLLGLTPASVSVSTVYRNQGPTDAAVRSRLLGALNQGPTIVNFFGHGSVQIWTSGSILKTADGPTLSNASSPSLYLMMTCLNGYFVDAGFQSLGESLVLAPNGGAIASWSSSGETVPTDQVVADQQAVKLLLNEPNTTLGDAMLYGKSVIRDIDVRHTWVLLGDPTTRLH